MTMLESLNQSRLKCVVGYFDGAEHYHVLANLDDFRAAVSDVLLAILDSALLAILDSAHHSASTVDAFAIGRSATTFEKVVIIYCSHGEKGKILPWGFPEKKCITRLPMKTEKVFLVTSGFMWTSSSSLLPRILPPLQLSIEVTKQLCKAQGDSQDSSPLLLIAPAVKKTTEGNSDDQQSTSKMAEATNRMSLQ